MTKEAVRNVVLDVPEEIDINITKYREKIYTLCILKLMICNDSQSSHIKGNAPKK